MTVGGAMPGAEGIAPTLCAPVGPAIGRDRSVRNMALPVRPDIIVDLHALLPGRRPIRALARRLDDPAAFVAAFHALVSPA